MARSQNGWTVFDSPPNATTPYITGRVRPGDVDVIFTYLGKRFNDEVEIIRPDWSWGWAKRPIRGSTSTISNHASATANDYNAPAHPLGKRGTFSDKQVDRIEDILRDLEGVVRWGGHYQSRADEMHFEIIGNAADAKRVADKIRKGTLGRPAVPAWKWDPTVKSDLPLVQREFQKGAGHVTSEALRRYHGVAAVQNALNVKAGANLKVDGFAGPATVKAMGDYERKRKVGTGYSTTPDADSLGPDGLQILYRFVNVPVAPTKPPAKVKARIAIHNTYVKRAPAEVNRTYSALLAKTRPHVVLLQETAQMYGKWSIPGYRPVQFAPVRLNKDHVVETSSSTVLVRNDVTVSYKDLLDLVETWKGPKVGAMHDPRRPLALTVEIEGKALPLLDVHGPFGGDAVAEFNAEIAEWIRARKGPAFVGGDFNQAFDKVMDRVAAPAGAVVDGKAPDMVVFKGLKKTGSANLDRQGSDTHDFKIFDLEI